MFSLSPFWEYNALRKISLKYAGRCGKCGQWIPAGETAFWEEGKGVWHLHCGASIVQETPDVRKPPQDRKHRFHLRPQLVGTILITIIAFSAGLAIGPYVTPGPPPEPPVTITVTSVVHDTLTVTITCTTCTTERPLPPSPCQNGRPKWLANTNVVSYLQATNYVGQSKTVEGTIIRTYVSKGTVFLDFHDPYQGYFVAVIFSSDVKNFPFPADSFYRNKEVRITGTIQLYQGAPEIIVHSPSQIEVACMGFNYP